MKNIKLNITVLGLFIIGLASCSDDFVDVDPRYEINSDTYFASADDYSNALIGAYDILHSTYVNVIVGEIASDNTNAGGGNANDVIGWQQIDLMQHTEVNDNLDDIWDWNLAGVQRAAYILENKDKIDFEGKAQIIAEASFLRAYFNFELVKWFGPIPIKPEGQFVLGEVTSVPRSPKEEVYAYIEQDLQFAIDNLSENAPEIGRVTKTAAQALLGKVYLYQDKFSESANQLNSVINSGRYHLYGTEQGEKYENLFDSIGQNSGESVFEIQYTNAEGGSFDCLQCSEGNVAVGFNGIRSYSGPKFEGGYGFNLPREEAYNAFEEGDLRRDYTVLDIEKWIAENSGETIEYAIGTDPDLPNGHTGYYNRKYLPRKNENPGDANLTQPNNYRAIRYADVLLMAAEALVRGNIDESLARTYLNQVRNRAELPNVNSSGEALLEDIYNDRRLEMMGEGHRFFDLVRTGRAAENIEGFTAGKNEVFPIPLEEIEFSNENWEQNDRY